MNGLNVFTLISEKKKRALFLIHVQILPTVQILPPVEVGPAC